MKTAVDGVDTAAFVAKWGPADPIMRYAFEDDLKEMFAPLLERARNVNGEVIEAAAAIRDALEELEAKALRA